MRISNFEKASIISEISNFANADIFLFGSRIDDSQKGGDIDILILTNSNEDFDNLNKNIYKILSNIKFKIGDQKIDLIIKNKNKADNFVDLVLENAIKLN